MTRVPPSARPQRRTPPLRPAVRFVLAAVLALTAVLAGLAPAAQAATYRYWGYWSLTGGSWTFAQKGPAQTTPADGAVEGWRFGLDDGTGSRPPRVTATFEQLCGATPTQAGSKRVGLVVDPGRDVDGENPTAVPALVAKCAVVPVAATGADVLAVAGGVRSEKGLVCSVLGYPATGCTAEVAALTDAQKAPDTPIALPTPVASTPAAAAPAAATAASTTTSTSGSGLNPWVWVAMALLVALVLLLIRRRRPVGT